MNLRPWRHRQRGAPLTAGARPMAPSTFSISGGIAPVQCPMVGGQEGSPRTPDLSGLVAGIYSGDLDRREQVHPVVPVNVTQPGLFSISATFGDHSGFAVELFGRIGDGAVDANVSGGTHLTSSTGAARAGFSVGKEDISALTAGTYVLSVSGASRCSVRRPSRSKPPPVMTGPAGQRKYPVSSTDGSIEMRPLRRMPRVPAWTGSERLPQRLRDMCPDAETTCCW